MTLDTHDQYRPGDTIGRYAWTQPSGPPPGPPPGRPPSTWSTFTAGQRKAIIVGVLAAVLMLVAWLASLGQHSSTDAAVVTPASTVTTIDGVAAMNAGDRVACTRLANLVGDVLNPNVSAFQIAVAAPYEFVAMQAVAKCCGR